MNISINISADSNEPTSQIKIIKKAKNDSSIFNYKYDGKNLNCEITSDESASDNGQAESLRRSGHKLWKLIHDRKIKSIVFRSDIFLKNACIFLAEGLLLSTYIFDKYKSKKQDRHLKEIYIDDKNVSDENISTLYKTVNANFIARDLVNEPPAKLTATDLSNCIVSLGNKYGFNTTVLEKSKIQSLKMGGLLSVNLGSETPPTFNILEWNPKGAKNKKPVVLIGKGVVYDTGGLSLKPTTNSMDLMKSDMAGSAAVIGAFCALASLNLPLHVIGLIAATDNRPGKNAYAPGDVIHMFDGTSVEVMNTDAEGRLTLADALSYAKKYKPGLVIDIATLTGAIIVALGSKTTGLMANDQKLADDLLQAGLDSHDKAWQLPLWDEYQEQLDSNFADIANIGSKGAGSITAACFLSRFTEKFTWAHLDIAGTAWTSGGKAKGATGRPVPMLVQYLMNRVSKS